MTEHATADRALLHRAADDAADFRAGLGDRRVAAEIGFVIGGSVDAATAAEIVVAGWDQCAFNGSLPPAAEDVDRSAAAVPAAIARVGS
jgi:hypothetical protein